LEQLLKAYHDNFDLSTWFVRMVEKHSVLSMSEASALEIWQKVVKKIT